MPKKIQNVKAVKKMSTSKVKRRKVWSVKSSGIYRAIVETSWISYNVKYSDEGDEICVTIPNSMCLINKQTRVMDEDFRYTLKLLGWTDVAIKSLLEKILFPPSGVWHTGSTINDQTGVVVQGS